MTEELLLRYHSGIVPLGGEEALDAAETHLREVLEEDVLVFE